MKNNLVAAARIVAWALAAALALLSIVPPHFRVATGLPHDLEHVVAFFLLGTAFGCGYAQCRLRVILVGLSALGALELLQTAMPGRHGTVLDLTFNVIGFCLGVAVSQLVSGILSKRDPS
jgi:VanZ family protein